MMKEHHNSRRVTTSKSSWAFLSTCVEYVHQLALCMCIGIMYMTWRSLLMVVKTFKKLAIYPLLSPLYVLEQPSKHKLIQLQLAWVVWLKFTKTMLESVQQFIKECLLCLHNIIQIHNNLMWNWQYFMDFFWFFFSTFSVLDLDMSTYMLCQEPLKYKWMI